MRRSFLLFFLLVSLLYFFPVYSQTTVQVSGHLRDADTQLPVEGASVVIRQLKRGVVTDSSGHFTLLAPAGKYDVMVSFAGYHNISTIVEFSEGREVRLEIKRKPPLELAEVVIESANNTNVKGVSMSRVNINVALLRKNPNVFGEADIIKSVVLQGGVSTVGEGAGGFNVRGGNTDQNLVLLDGAPLFNTAHLLGFYSTVSPEAIHEVSLFKGTLPAEYGGRLSSLLLMQVKPGNPEKVRYNIGVSPISTRFFAEGPISKDRVTFLTGLRVAYPKVMMNLFPGSVKESNAFFYDGIAKLGYYINAQHQVYFTAYNAYDKFRFPGDTAFAWQSTIGSLRWNAQLTKKLNLNVNATHSAYASDIIGLRQDYQFQLRNDIRQQQVRASLNGRLSEKNQVTTGVEFTRYRINPGTLRPEGVSNINFISLQQESAREAALFIEDEASISFLTIRAGLRYTYYQNTGPFTVYHYKEGEPRSKETIVDSTVYSKGKTITGYQGLDPRIQLKFGIDNRTAIKMSYNRMRQFLHLISNTIAITPVDFWKLSGPLTKPAISDQYALGFFKNFDNDRIETSIEGFYKKMSRLPEYKNGARLTLNPYIESDLLPAQGKSYGLELMFRKLTGKYTGQLSYTYSRSQVAVVTPFPVEEVNDGNYYPSQYDRPHNVSITGMIRLGKGWSFNYTMVYTTGRPATFPDGNYIIDSTVVPNYSKRNADRLKDYHRLDIAFSYDSRRLAEQKRYSLLNFSLYNLYARKNPYSVYFKREGAGLYPYSLSVLGTIIPSITWNYYF